MDDRSTGLRFLHGSCVPRCDAVLDKDFVGYRTIQFMEAGAIELQYGARRWHLEGRWAWPHWPGPRTRLRGAGGTWHHRHIAVSGPLVEAWAAEGLWPTGPQPVPPALDLGALMDECLALFRRPDRPGLRRAVNRLEDILLVLQEARGAAAEPPWLARARTLLAEPIGLRTAVAAVARRCGMPESTFRRRFAAAAGMSPRDWALAARMERARDLLASGLGAAEVAATLGYEDASLFGRQFRARHGVPPATWRREFA